MNSKMDQFRAFVEKHPLLRNEVRSNKMTWQNIYEEWYLYGENSNTWKQYQEVNQDNPTEEKNDKNSSVVNMDSIKSIVGYIQKLNPDNVNKTLNSAQKVIQIVQTLNGGKSSSVMPNIGNGMYSDWWD